MVDLPGKNGDFLSFFVCLTEGTYVIYIIIYIYVQNLPDDMSEAISE